MYRIFINDFGRLRSGWRLLIFVLALIAASIILTTILRAAYLVVLAFVPEPRFSSYALEAIFRFSSLAAALIAGYLCARFLEGLPWKSLGLTLHEGWLRDLILGSLIGFSTLVVAVAIAVGGGGLRFSFGELSILPVMRAMVVSAGFLFVAALAEEALFRGYPLQTLTRARLVALAIFLSSVPFGLVHLSNPNVDPAFTFINTALAGLWFAVAYLRTRSLWLPQGLHWSWNWAQGWFFGLPVSGLNLISHPLLKATDEGPAWLTGGRYGIEGSIACTVALTLFTIFLWRTSLLKATPELKQLTSEENPALPATL